jgi:hypothetical protein
MRGDGDGISTALVCCGTSAGRENPISKVLAYPAGRSAVLTFSVTHHHDISKTYTTLQGRTVGAELLTAGEQYPWHSWMD